MCRRKPYKSLFGLALSTLLIKRREGCHCLLTILNMRNSTLRMIEFSPILKGLKIKWELWYFRRKEKQNNQRTVVTNWLQFFRWPWDQVTQNAIEFRGSFTNLFVNKLALLVLSGQSLARLQWTVRVWVIWVKVNLFGTFVWAV